jgi:hypothetical protein
VSRAINIKNGAFERQDNQRYSLDQFNCGAGTDFDPKRSGTLMRNFDSFCSAALIAGGLSYETGAKLYRPKRRRDDCFARILNEAAKNIASTGKTI